MKKSAELRVIHATIGVLHHLYTITTERIRVPVLDVLSAIKNMFFLMYICASQVFLCPVPLSNLSCCSSSTVASLLYLTHSGPSLSFSALSHLCSQFNLLCWLHVLNFPYIRAELSVNLTKTSH